MTAQNTINDPANFIWPVSLAFHNSSLNNLLEYGVFSDGIYCRQNVFADKFITYKCDDIKGLPKGKDELHPIAGAKIPFKLYEDTIAFFRYIIKERGKVEAYVLYACQPDGKYFIYVPKQTVGGANVTYTLEDFHTEHPDCYIVADQHSHVEFGAFWSGTDDADDKRNRYSVVSGMHQKLYPEVKVRFSFGKRRVDLQLDDLFEHNENYEVSKNLVMEESIKQIDRHVVQIYTGYAGGYQGGYGKGNSGKGYNNYYKDYQYGQGKGSQFGAEGGLTGDSYGDLYNWDEDDYGYPNYGAAGNGKIDGNSIYSSDRQQYSQDAARSGTVIKCDKCGKFTNMVKAKKIKGDYLCNDCIAAQQDAEEAHREGTSPSQRRDFRRKNASSLGEALLNHVTKPGTDIKGIHGLGKLQSFLSELKEA